MEKILKEWKKFINEQSGARYSYSYCENAVNLIKKYESFSEKVYQRPGDKPTIGFGTTVYISDDGKTKKPVTINDGPISQEDADSYLRNYLDYVVMPSFNRYNKRRDLNQNQIDSMVSVMYNKGNSSFLNSPLFSIINNNPKDTRIKDAFIQSATGKAPGILKRREEEWRLYSLQGTEDTVSNQSKPFL